MSSKCSGYALIDVSGGTLVDLGVIVRKKGDKTAESYAIETIKPFLQKLALIHGLAHYGKVGVHVEVAIEAPLQYHRYTKTSTVAVLNCTYGIVSGFCSGMFGGVCTKIAANTCRKVSVEILGRRMQLLC